MSVPELRVVQSRLYEAIVGGDLALVRSLHEEGADLREAADEPLCLAAEYGHLDLVRYIHSNGGNIRARNDEPLVRAASAGHLNVVIHLCQSGADIRAQGERCLRAAARHHHAHVVRYLHEQGAATHLLGAESIATLAEMEREVKLSRSVYKPAAFWIELSKVNRLLLAWFGEAEFKRTLNQNYFNFVPQSAMDPRMVRMRRLMPNLDQAALDQYVINDPDYDPERWGSWYAYYQIFKDPDREGKRELYRQYLGMMYEYALRRDGSGLLAQVEEPELGNPIRVFRKGKLISQDIINSLRERNIIVTATAEMAMRPQFKMAELGAGYGRHGHVMLLTTPCRYFVFDIAPALHLSQWYLAKLFPGRRLFRFRPFARFDEVETELAEAELAFFTPNQLEKFPDRYFDAFATISSLHEMRRNQIRHFMRLMGRTTASLIYIKQQKNYRNPVDDLVIKMDDYPAPPGWVASQEHFDLINPGFFERIYQRIRQDAALGRRSWFNAIKW